MLLNFCLYTNRRSIFLKRASVSPNEHILHFVHQCLELHSTNHSTIGKMDYALLYRHYIQYTYWRKYWRFLVVVDIFKPYNMGYGWLETSLFQPYVENEVLVWNTHKNSNFKLSSTEVHKNLGEKKLCQQIIPQNIYLLQFNIEREQYFCTVIHINIFIFFLLSWW